jgi:hypothetical protein
MHRIVLILAVLCAGIISAQAQATLRIGDPSSSVFPAFRQTSNSR